MDPTKLTVIYVNRRFRVDREVSAPVTEDASSTQEAECEADDLRQDVEVLRNTFAQVLTCSSGASCLNKLFDIEEGVVVDLRPAMILIDIPEDEQMPEEPAPCSRSPSPLSRPISREAEIHTPDEEVYGLRLLQRIMTEAHLRNLSRMVVPILLIGQSSSALGDEAVGIRPVDRRLVIRCLDMGATDVIIRPMHAKCMMGLEVHAHRAKKDAAREQQAILELRRGRKRSWVGVNEERPFAYLREAMVSGLMKGICRLSMGEDDRISNVSIAVSSERQAAIAAAIGKWHFCAHDFTDDELLVAAMYMFKHALTMPELERWRIPADQLVNFLVACRAAYNSFVPYHNFRHVIDVLQATFSFLVNSGTLARYPPESDAPAPAKSPIASLLHPFDGLTLLITAIGHDVGHPGVNNGFLISLNAPLAQLYNDKSVLESFHCAAYSQILRRYWPAAFEDTKMRKLMISSILATDMGMHFDYMKKLGDLQDKLHVDKSTETWNGRLVEEQKALACELLIKCADISNVARQHDTALQWMHILSDEFSRQASMEAELEIKTTLMAPPPKEFVELAQSQLNFMNLFAIPLFQGVADIIPSMQYTVDELERNKQIFSRQISEEKAKESPIRKRLLAEGTLSPRTMSFAVDPEARDSTPKAGTPPASGTPSTVTDGKKTVEQDVHSHDPEPPKEKVPSQDSQGSDKTEIPEHQTNGYAMPTTFDAVADFAASDPFRSQEPMSTSTEKPSSQNGKQRFSETTEDSAPGQYQLDWTSQATSATTGKMPLSPSTRGTSIVSGDSGDPRASITKPATTTAAAPSCEATSQSTEPPTPNGSVGKADGIKALRKKSSRFRMNNFNFFRRNKNPASPAASMTNDKMG